MFISHFVVVWLLVMLGQLNKVATAPINPSYKESFGLESIQDFCRGEGRLDDLKDLAADVYRLKTGRFYVVSIIYTTPSLFFIFFVSFNSLFPASNLLLLKQTATQKCVK